MVSYNKSTLKKLEAFITNKGYKLIYDKGQFKSGFCIVNQSKTVVVNKYFDTQGKISALQEIVEELGLEDGIFSKRKD